MRDMARLLCLEKDQSESAPTPSFAEEQYEGEELITPREEVKKGGRTSRQTEGRTEAFHRQVKRRTSACRLSGPAVVLFVPPTDE